ncbi:MAG: PCP reductase family protein, partial [Acidobacteria bacterium]|nr:PCP reductase family protein [Acidobacteriota bacterium]
ASEKIVVHAESTTPAPGEAATEDPELKILARDAKNNPLISRWDWTEKAIERILRVPAGFMRDRTQRRIEELAEELGAVEIDFALVEDGIEHGKQMMAEMLGQYERPAEGVGEAETSAGPPRTAEPAERARPALNEVGFMSALEKKRRELNNQQAES